MLYNLAECIIYLLATYGLFQLVLGIVGMITGRIPAKRPEVKLVLLVRDAQEHIEYMIRYMVRKDITSRVFSDRKLTVIDMGSGDQTTPILEKLQKDFSNIEVLTADEKDSIFDDFSIFSTVGK